MVSWEGDPLQCRPEYLEAVHRVKANPKVLIETSLNTNRKIAVDLSHGNHEERCLIQQNEFEY